MDNNLLILGAGAHGQVVKETAKAMGIFGKIDFLDDDSTKKEILSACSEYKRFKNQYKYAFPSFGSMKIRMDYIKQLAECGFTVPILYHPTAFISPTAKIERGTIVEAHAIINTNSIIEEGCIISVGAIIDHDAFIVEGCHIDCGAIVGSNCKIILPKKIQSGTVVKTE
jgi:UDP-N-acetylbacillosamine N-acetyltransferase